jgi:hypothetical protein
MRLRQLPPEDLIGGGATPRLSMAVSPTSTSSTRAMETQTHSYKQ